MCSVALLPDELTILELMSMQRLLTLLLLLLMLLTPIIL
jgi:hypothetical protein